MAFVVLLLLVWWLVLTRRFAWVLVAIGAWGLFCKVIRKPVWSQHIYFLILFALLALTRSYWHFPECLDKKAIGGCAVVVAKEPKRVLLATSQGVCWEWGRADVGQLLYVNYEFSGRKLKRRLEEGCKGVSGGLANLVLAMWNIRDRLLEVVYKKLQSYGLDETQTGLFLGLVFGERLYIPPGVYEKAKKVGLLHIIVVSGYNISLALAFVDIVVRWLSVGKRRVVALGVSLAFLWIVGPDPPVVRAVVFSVVGILLEYWGINTFTEFRFALGLLILGLVNPRYIYNVSFLLSIAATCGVVFVGSSVVERLKRFKRILGPFWGLLETAIFVIAVNFTIAPVLFYFFREVRVGFLANVLVLPVLDLFTPLAYWGLWLILVPGLGWFYALLLRGFLDYFLIIIDFFGG